MPQYCPTKERPSRVLLSLGDKLAVPGQEQAGAAFMFAIRNCAFTFAEMRDSGVRASLSKVID